MPQNRVSKYFVSGFILLALLFNSVGYILIYHQQLYAFKNQSFLKLQSYLTVEDMCLIGLKKTDILKGRISFQRLEEKEFKLNGKMYDIVKEVEKKDSVYFFCINDEKEDELHKAFVKYFTENSNQGNNKSTSGNIFRNLITEGIVPQYISRIFNVRKVIYYGSAIIFFQSNITDTPSPPPKG